MPAVSKAQQRFMGMVYAAKKGEMKNPSPEVADAAASMKKKDAKDFASTKHKGLPEKKEVKEEDNYSQKKKELKKTAPPRNKRFKELHSGTNTAGNIDVNEMKGYGEERFCELCGKMEYQEECSYGPKMWDMFTIKNFTEELTGWRKELPEAYTFVQERGRTYTIIFNWRGKTLKAQMFFNKFGRPSREEIRQELNKVYPNPFVLYYNIAKKEPTLPLLFAGGENESR